MRIFRQYAALSLLILFEIAAGILLLWSPGGVAAAVLFLFGIVMVVIGGMNLVRFFKEKPEGFGGFLVCMVGVAALGVGVFSLIPSTQGMLLHYVAILYALIFFVAGLYEAQMFFSAKKADRPVSVMLLVSAILAIVFGVAAHEIGHFINHYTLCSFERRPTNQGEAIIQTTKVNDRWDELCADYQAGIIMAMASPRLDHTTLMNMMVGTHADSAHPDGFWRVMAIDMGYQWACAHSEMLNSRVITDDKSRCDLLSSFMKSFYEKVYKRVDPLTRASHSVLTNAFMEEVSYLIQYI